MGTINYSYLYKGYTKINNNIALIDTLDALDFDDMELYGIYLQDDFDYVKSIIDGLKTYYFNIEIDGGYYDGFNLILTDKNTKYIYNDYSEKIDVLKELTEIKKVLLKLIDDGFIRGCAPFWYNTYLEKKDTKKRLSKLIQELKQDVKKSYTEYTAKNVDFREIYGL